MRRTNSACDEVDMRISLQNNRWHFYTISDTRYPLFLFLACGKYHAACSNDIMGFWLGFATQTSSVSQSYTVYGAWDVAIGTSVVTKDEAAAELVHQGLIALREGTRTIRRDVAIINAATASTTLLAIVAPDTYELTALGSGYGAPKYAVRRDYMI